MLYGKLQIPSGILSHQKTKAEAVPAWRRPVLASCVMATLDLGNLIRLVQPLVLCVAGASKSLARLWASSKHCHCVEDLKGILTAESLRQWV